MKAISRPIRAADLAKLIEAGVLTRPQVKRGAKVLDWVTASRNDYSEPRQFRFVIKATLAGREIRASFEAPDDGGRDCYRQDPYAALTSIARQWGQCSPENGHAELAKEIERLLPELSNHARLAVEAALIE